MGLGKTVMTIALILARRGRGHPNDQEFSTKDASGAADISKNKRGKDTTDNKDIGKVKGGTLIVCPMALLGQWKVSPYLSSKETKDFLPFICVRIMKCANNHFLLANKFL